MTEPLKLRLRQGATVVGGWLSLGSAAIAEIMCRAGFDFVVVDLEHTTTTLESTEAILRTVEHLGKTPLVRISTLDPVQIKRVLDAGAHGIIVPMVRSVEDVEAAAQAMFYPPRGTRGVGLGRAQAYGPGFQGYLDSFAERALLIPQIENRDAVRNIDSILGHPDVDACLVGPYDLSASLGVPGALGSEPVLSAMAEVLAAAARAGVPAGIHQVAADPNALQLLRADGYRFLVYGVDFTMLDAACRAGVARLHGG